MTLTQAAVYPLAQRLLLLVVYSRKVFWILPLSPSHLLSMCFIKVLDVGIEIDLTLLIVPCIARVPYQSKVLYVAYYQMDVA